MIEEKVVYFVRHAESAQNTGASTKEFDSFKLIPLTEEGENQAKVLAYTTLDPSRLQVPPHKITSSDFLRAIQTAQPTAKRYGVELNIDPMIGEADYLDPTSFSEAQFTNSGRQELTEAYWFEHTDPNYRHTERVESFQEMVDRFDHILNQIRDDDFETQCVFSHGLYIKGVVWRGSIHQNKALSHQDKPEFRRFCADFKVSNCSVLPVRVRKDKSLIFMGMIDLPAVTAMDGGNG